MDLRTFVSRLAATIGIVSGTAVIGCTTPMAVATLDAAVGDSSISLVDAGGDAHCTPISCAPDACGSIADGCGSTIDCGTCACTPATMDTDCPSRPCEVVVGCDAGTCRYEPVTCDFARCDCPDGGCADDTTPRSCGTGCATTVCDPRPSDVAGRIVFANACVPREDLRCGLCDLGSFVCGADEALTCETPSFDWIDAATAECDGSSALSSIVYVDAVVADVGDGSREHPFQTLSEAMTAAIVRGSRLVVIGRSPRIDGTVSIASGVSILGGFGGWPSWRRDDTERPVFHAGASDVADGRLVGLQALAIHEPTRVQHVRVETDDLLSADGTSAAGVWANDAPALELVDIELSVGRAADGSAGADGAIVTASLAGGTFAADGVSSSGAACGVALAGATSAIVSCDGAPRPEASGGAGATSIAPPVGTGRIYPGLDAPTGARGGLGYDSAVRPEAEAGALHGAPLLASAGIYGYAWSDGFPLPTGAGRDGYGGADGNGGGGGASGRRFHAVTSAGVLSCTIGGAGGAGGSGGCGGRGGRGGQSGGWVFGLVITASRGIVIDSVVATVAYGGEGGAGGLGSAGTAGWSGTAGGVGPITNEMWRGRPGGAGSAGQRGADGGRGAGGGARGVLCDGRVDLDGVSATSVAVDFIAMEGCS